MIYEICETKSAKQLLSAFAEQVKGEVAVVDKRGDVICSYGDLPFLCKIVHNKDPALCKQNCVLNSDQKRFACESGFMTFNSPITLNGEKVAQLLVRGHRVATEGTGFLVLSEQIGIDLEELQEEYAKIALTTPEQIALIDAQTRYLGKVFLPLCAEELKTSKKIQSLSSFQKLHGLLSSTADLESVINNVLRFLTTELPFTHAVVHLSDLGQAYLSSQFTFPREEIEAKLSASIGDYAQTTTNIASSFMLSTIADIDKVHLSVTGIPIVSSDQRIALFFCYGDSGLSLNDVEQELLEVLKLRFKDIIIKHLQLESAQKSAITDKLTHLFNRRYFNDRLVLELAEAKDNSAPISMIMCDLDHFKALNDNFGHQKGDEVLSIFGKLIRKIVRRSDIPCRYGGEEFSIILPHTPLSDAKMVAERIREEVEHYDFGHIEEQRKVTVSVGVATCSNGSIDANALVKEADAALYRSKNLGRNRVECSLVVDRSIGAINVNEVDDMYVQKSDDYSSS